MPMKNLLVISKFQSKVLLLIFKMSGTRKKIKFVFGGNLVEKPYYGLNTNGPKHFIVFKEGFFSMNLKIL